MADKNYSDDFISLSGFTKGLKSFLRFLFRLDVFLLRAIRTNVLTFIAIVLIGFIVAVSYFYIKPVQYDYTMIVEFNTLTRKTYYEVFNQLNSLAGSGARQEMARELGITDTTADPIATFTVENLNDQPLATDTSTIHRSALKISMIASRAVTDLPVLQNALLDYLNNRPFLKSAKAGEQRIYADKMLYIDFELKKLDSLKELYNKGLINLKIPSTVYINSFNPSDLYIRSNELMNQKTELIRWISVDAKAISLIDGFKAIGRPSSKSLTVLLILASLITVPLAIVVCCIVEIRKWLSA